MRSLSLLTLLLAVSPAAAQRNANVPDPDPELERKSFQVADGFEVNLYAADPLLAKPIQMNFDPAGRLWVASSEIYPQIKPGEVANDKVLVLEDTNGDGTADKTTVFADGLLIPTGVAPGDGGVYVADSTDIVHFSDPDPKTGKARKRRVVLSGFGTEDTHHIVHTFQWMPDGALYFNQSIYIHSHVETPHGVRRLNAGGIWQYRPETTSLDVFARGWVNSWGHKWDKWGVSYATDGAGGEGINYVVPGAYYVTAQGSPRILPGLNPGSPKMCGLEVASGRHLPDDWQGDLITNDFRGHRVCRFKVQPDGAGFASKEMPEVIKTSHGAFRPIDVAMGPDGAIYVADWYNPIIQHGEVDFRDPRRDKTHGRIWRVTAKNRKPVDRPKLVDASVPDLLEALKSPEQWTRNNAKRVLKERGRDAVLQPLTEWMLKLNGLDSTHAQLEALWMFQSLGGTPTVPAVALADQLAVNAEPNARAATARVVGEWQRTRPGAVELLEKLAVDENPRVRLEAVRALALVNTPRATEAAAKALDKPVDRWLDYAIWLTLREAAPVWLPEVQAGKLDFGGDPRKITFALQAAGTGDVVKPLVALWANGKIGRDRAGDVLPLIASLGGPAELRVAWTDAGKLPKEQAGTVAAVVSALEQSARTRNAKPDVGRDVVAGLIGSPDAGLKLAAVKLAGAWKEPIAREPLAAVVGQPDSPAPLRMAAAQALAEIGTPESAKALAALAGTSHPTPVRLAAASALAAVDAAGAAKLAADLLSGEAAPVDPTELVAAFAGRKGGAAALAKALAGKKVSADASKLGVRAAKAAGQPDQSLVDALTAAGGLTAPKRDWTRAEIDALAAEATASGDAAHGERVFRRADLSCLKCHGIAGAGGAVGPDLTSLGASAPADYLVESMHLPNAKIKEGYNSYVVSTLDGKVVTGIKVREGDGKLVLRDAEDREVTVPVADIDARKDGKSLMPEGLTDPLTKQEFLDLIKFLSLLGKVGGGYQASPGKVVRRWEAAQWTKELHTLTNRDRVGAVAKPGAEVTWAPAYALVSGDLPVADLPTFQPHKNGPVYAAARFQLDVTAAGPVKLTTPRPDGMSFWVDGVPLTASNAMTVSLKPGLRTVVVAIDTGPRKDAVRVELDEVPGSPARARIVGGK